MSPPVTAMTVKSATRSIDRRTIVRTGAWSAPALAVVAAAPARAGSEPHVGSVTATKGAMTATQNITIGKTPDGCHVVGQTITLTLM